MFNTFSTLSGDTASAGLSVLMILAKATLVLMGALVVTRVMERGSAVSRHLVWFVSLGSLLLIPALASWSPLRLAILPAETAAPIPSMSAGPTGNGPSAALPSGAPSTSGPATVAPAPAPTPNVEATVNTVRGIVSPDTPWFGILRDPKLLFGIWATVAVLFAGWLAFGAMSVRRIISRSRELDSADWMNPLWEVADRLELDKAPRLVRSEDAKMPFACGLVRPTIVLPAECDSWTLDRRRAVLLHELAHVRRRDLVGHTVGRFACALYWFHPLVWTAAKRLRSESERACDDLALTCGARASDYAEHLLDIVTGVRHHATPAVALAMARRKEFEGRMLAILDPELRRGAPSRKQTVGLVGALAVMSLLVGAAVPVARAADGSVRPTRYADAAAKGASTDTTSFRDEEMSQSVRTVDRRATREETSVKTEQRIDSTRRRGDFGAEIGREAGREVGREVGRQVGQSVGKTVGKNVGEIVGNTLTTVVPAAIEAAVPAAAQSIQRMLNQPQSQQGGKDERPALLANVLKTDSSASLRRVAAWGLAQFADADVATEALATAVRRDNDASVRETAAWALAGARGSTAVVEALTTALRRDANVKVRGTAAWALGSVGDKGAVDELAAALSDTSRSVRYRSAWAIGSIGPRQAPKPLVAALSDKDAEMRQIVAWALFTIEDPDAVPALTAAMRAETDKDTQRALIRALAATGERSVDAIKALIDSKDPDVRAAAIRALAGGGANGPWPHPWPDPRPHPY
jgi:beta-lactamase regulating signal transducer with metallopeptidase domain/HEAT repeat protein